MPILCRVRAILPIAGAAFFAPVLLFTGCRSPAPIDASRLNVGSPAMVTSRPPLVAGAYFGLPLPGDTPELFAPGIINVPDRSVARIAFSPDGTECAVTVFESVYANNRILHTRYEMGQWTPLQPFPGPDGREILEPLFSRDNGRLYFAVKSPGVSNVDFWEAERTAGGWTHPRPLPAPFNSSADEFCLAETAHGTVFFASRREVGRGGLDLYRSAFPSGDPVQIENLGTPVNSSSDDGDPAISPDGRILIFYSASNRPRASGNSDLFICFSDGDGGWTTPVNMGAGFNTPAAEYAATFSHDGTLLFFARFDGRKGEIFWVSTAGLESFRARSEAAAALTQSSDGAPEERRSVHVSPQILRRYVGTYVLESQPGFTNQITLEADQLMTQVSGQPMFPLFAQSETRFFLRVADAEVEFLLNGQLEATALIVHQGGNAFRMMRKDDAGHGPTNP